jgi:hypothetical protein
VYTVQDMEVIYYHAYIDGVDFVFIDNPIFHHVENDIYGGDRTDILKRMVLLCKAAIEVKICSYVKYTTCLSMRKYIQSKSSFTIIWEWQILKPPSTLHVWLHSQQTLQ